MHELEPRLLLSAVLLPSGLPDLYITASGGTASIDLNQFFDDTDIAGTVVTFDTVYGEFDVELYDDDTPITVDNFLGYVDRGDYDGTFIHRNALLQDNTPFVVQGGGFIFKEPNKYNEIFQGSPIGNEPGISNTRGTIAMAKLGGDPDSATNQWFINMGDNSANLDNQNGGFTVFGQVLGTGMDIVDMIADTPVWDASSINSAFGDLPLRNFTNDHFPNNSELVVINSITRGHELTFSIKSRSQPTRMAGLVDADGILTLFTIGTSVPQDMTVTIEATDRNGATVEGTITVHVGDAKESLDNDRFADLIWRSFKDGQNMMWDMATIAKLGNVPLDSLNGKLWYIAAVGDLNQDGNNDLVWRNAYDGQNLVWLMNGTTFDSSVELRTVANKNWVIGGIADFNNDGKNDILWRQSAKGRNVVWTMDGTNEVGSLTLDNLGGARWYIGGVADFDRDGAADIFWRNNDNGQNRIWLLNKFDGSLKQTVSQFNEPNTGWVVGAIGDFIVDNQPDILWRNVNTGQHMLWVMDGTTRRVVRTDLPNRRNTAWQLPGRSSQLLAEQKAQAKIQRLKRKAARLSAASSTSLAVAANASSDSQTASLLAEVQPILTLDTGDGDSGSGFALDDNGQVSY